MEGNEELNPSTDSETENEEVAANAQSANSETEPPSSEELDPMAQLQAEAIKWREVAMRSQAELENFRKRMSREKQDAIKFGTFGLLESLLPVIDNFRFGLDAARQEAEDSVVFQGMSMVMKQLEDFFADQGVTEVLADGETFDPNIHEAIKQEASDDVEEGKITAVVRCGYRLHDRLLRPAHVIVSKGPESAAEEGSSADSPENPPASEA